MSSKRNAPDILEGLATLELEQVDTMKRSGRIPESMIADLQAGAGELQKHLLAIAAFLRELRNDATISRDIEMLRRLDRIDNP